MDVESPSSIVRRGTIAVSAGQCDRIQLNSIDLKIIIRGRADEAVLLNGAYPDSSSNYLPGDKVFVLYPDDVESAAVSIAEDIRGSGRKVRNLTVVAQPDAETDIDSILDYVEPFTSDEPDLHLHCAHIDLQLFDRLIMNWDQVNLVGCELGFGWWIRKQQRYRCTYLWIEECRAHPIPPDYIESGGWLGLDILTINEGITNVSLMSRERCQFLSEPTITHISDHEANTSELARSLCGPTLTRLSLQNCEDVSFLIQMEEPPSLQALGLSGSPCTNEVLEWASRLKGIARLELAKASGVEMDWSLLAALPLLRELDVTSSRFNDNDLEEVLRYTRIQGLDCYYTELTPRSWAGILRSPRLLTVWVSTEMLEGDLPDDLPPETSVDEIVMMNVGKRHEAYLRELLRRYPEVQTHSM